MRENGKGAGKDGEPSDHDVSQTLSGGQRGARLRGSVPDQAVV